MRDDAPILSDDEQRILDTVLATPTRRKAAEVLGVSEATLYRHLREPHMREAERRARLEQLADATATLQKLAAQAAATLAVIMLSQSAPYSARVTAASKLLDMAYRATEIQEIEARLDALERVAA